MESGITHIKKVISSEARNLVFPSAVSTENHFSLVAARRKKGLIVAPNNPHGYDQGTAYEYGYSEQPNHAAPTPPLVKFMRWGAILATFVVMCVLLYAVMTHANAGAQPSELGPSQREIAVGQTVILADDGRRYEVTLVSLTYNSDHMATYHATMTIPDGRVREITETLPQIEEVPREMEGNISLFYEAGSMLIVWYPPLVDITGDEPTP